MVETIMINTFEEPNKGNPQSGSKPKGLSSLARENYNRSNNSNNNNSAATHGWKSRNDDIALYDLAVAESENR